MWFMIDAMYIKKQISYLFFNHSLKEYELT